jgi:dTDP-4-dehydrorhamnose reductase
MPKWIVVGGDGLIGNHLADWSGRVAAQILVTTRRRGGKDGRLFVDLDGEGVGHIVSAGADVIFLCAAMTNMRACQDAPELSYRINVSATVGLAERLIEQGAFVIFLSSNAVFAGTIPWPHEEQVCSPTCEYGGQKAGAEQLLLALPGAADRMAIVRLSKVLSPNAGIAAEFLRRMRSQARCDAFEDVRMSPISLRYVANGLYAIASRKLPGIFHLSGTEELSYGQFASRLANCLGADARLIHRVSSVQAGVDVVFRPRHPGLGMGRTTSLLGISPEPLDELLLEISRTKDRDDSFVQS